MIVVGDSSVFMNLAVIDQLDLLPSIFTKIFIPKAVYHEIVVLGTGKPGSQEVKNAHWIEVYPCTDITTLNKLLKVLDQGEAEALTLAHELDADLLIVDEKRGRQLAHDMNIPITGLLGVLLLAKQEGLISEVKTWMLTPKSKSKF